MQLDPHNQPLISIDVVPVRFADGELTIGLGNRQYDPYKGDLALPGVLLLQGESIKHGAQRALQTKVGILPEHAGHRTQVGAFDGTNRDPRGATISIALLSTGQYEEANETRVTWVKPEETGDLPFDHTNIIRQSLQRLGQVLWLDVEVTRSMLGKRFSTADAIALSQAVGSMPTDVKNFGRWLASNSNVVKVEGQTQAAGRGRPAAVWTWT